MCIRIWNLHNNIFIVCHGLHVFPKGLIYMYICIILHICVYVCLCTQPVHVFY